MYIQFGMSQKYIDDLSRNVKRGLKTKVEKGWYPGNAPLGYSQFRNGPYHTNLTRKLERAVSPRGPWRYDKPVVLLIGQKCMSIILHGHTFAVRLWRMRDLGIAFLRTSIAMMQIDVARN
jgi:hypothetical protein